MKISKLLAIFSFTFFLVSCSSASVKTDTHTQNQKAFANEDTYILYALYAEQIGDYMSAASFFKKLYDKSSKKEYLYHYLGDLLVLKNYTKVIKIVDKETEKKTEDISLERIKIVALSELYRLQEAAELSKKVLEKSKDVKDYLLISDIYVKLEKPKTALKYLNTYINSNGCSEKICSKIVMLYANLNDVEGVLKTYLRLYSLDKDEEIAKKIVQIYAYKKDFINMMDFLEKSRSDDESLLELYANYQKYTKAYNLAKELYEKSSNIEYLARSAIYEYESSVDKNDKKMLEKVVKTLEKVVDNDKLPLYLNYLGYILIDHNLDIKEGMKYIQEALEAEPDSVYYLDSLAWGYFKMGNCKKADSIMQSLQNRKGADNEEVVLHVDAIHKCLEKR